MSAPWTSQDAIDALADADLFLVVDDSVGANRTVSSTQVLTYIENQLSFLNQDVSMNAGVTVSGAIKQPFNVPNSGFIRMENNAQLVWNAFTNNFKSEFSFTSVNTWELTIDETPEFTMDTTSLDIHDKDLTSVNAISSGDTTPEEIVKFVDVTDAVKEITITNADVGSNPKIQATADSGSSNLLLEGSGTGLVSALSKLVAGDDFEVLGVADMDQTLDVVGKITTNDDLQVDKRLLTSEQGGTQTISSVSVTLGGSGNVFRLRADSAQFMDSINTTNWTLGSIVVIHFISNNITVRNQETVGEPQREIHLSTNEFNEIGTLTLYLESGAWIEISRTVLN